MPDSVIVGQGLQVALGLHKVVAQKDRWVAEGVA